MAKSEKDLAAEALAAMTGSSPPPDPVGDVSGGPADEPVAAPAPDVSVFAPKRRTAELILQRQLDAYRTAIPILLTLGLLFPVVGSLKWLAGEGSPFAEWDIWVPVALGLAGAGLLAVGIINILHVRNHLARFKR